MKKALLALLCTLLCTNLTAQNFSWAKSLSGLDADDARAMTLDNEGNVLVTGYFSDSIDADPGAGVLNMAPQGGTYDFLIQKLTPSGDLIWARQISGTAEEYANAIITDANGGIYLTGIFEDTVDFDPSVGTDTLISAGMNDIFILHLDSAGQFVWVKQIGGTENDYGFDVDVDAAGNIYVVGNFNSNAGIDFDPGPGVEMRFTALSNWDAFTLKLDSNGDFIWVKQTFGAVYDAGQSVEIDNSGNVYTVGAVATRVFVQKLAPDATNIWLRDFGALDFNTVQNNKGKLDPFGNLFISGTFSNTVDFDSGVAVHQLVPQNRDIYTVKMDTANNVIWAKRVGGPQDDYSLSLDVDAAGNIYNYGNFNGTADFDPGVNTYDLTSATNLDFFLQKLDNSGDFLWAGQFGQSTYYTNGQIVADDAGAVYATGSFSGVVDFDPGAGVFNMSSTLTTGDRDIFILKLFFPAGVSEVSNTDNHCTVYPNPSGGPVNIISQENIDKLEVKDVLGKRIYIAKPGKKETTFTIETPGIYFITVSSANKVQTEKLIVQ